MKWKYKAGEGERERGREGESGTSTSGSLFRSFALSLFLIPRVSASPRLLALVLLFGITGCAYYSFTGASIPEHLNTIGIPIAEDNTTSPFPALNEDLTQRLISRFVGQTRLRLEPSEEEADAVLLATLARYTNQPTSVSGEERAALNRVSITVNVRYQDQVNDTELLQRTFSGYADYDPIAAGLDGEVEAARLALENIADDIFTAATSNW